MGPDQAILLNIRSQQWFVAGASEQARNRMLLDEGISHRLDNSGPDLYGAGDQSDFPAEDYVGPDHEASVGQHARDAPVPESVEGPARTYPAAGHHLPHRHLRTGRGRSGEPHLCGHQGDSVEHTGLRRIAAVLLSELGGASNAAAPLLPLAGRTEHPATERGQQIGQQPSQTNHQQGLFTEVTDGEHSCDNNFGAVDLI